MYFDAYVGDDVYDEVIENNNKQLMEEEYKKPRNSLITRPTIKIKP